MPDLLLRGGRPWRSDAPADILIREGVIERIGPDLRPDPAAEVVDVPGRLLLPGLIDAHCHLDKTLFGGRWVPHSAGPALADRIGEERRRRAELGLPDVERMTALLEQMVASGTTHIRTHTDVITDHGLAGVEAVQAARERLGGRVTIEQVASDVRGTRPDREGLCAVSTSLTFWDVSADTVVTLNTGMRASTTVRGRGPAFIRHQGGRWPWHACWPTWA
jgi:cytosine deaminase